jgi:hypothetical protein
MREVRQRCGFGCIICGLPIYEYDHILGWAKVREHLARDITLLCDLHHREKTSGLLPDDLVIAANKAPWNLRTGVTKPYSLYYYGNHFSFDIGTNLFQGTDRGNGTSAQVLRIDGQPLLSAILDDGHYLLNLTVYNGNQDIILQIVDNELVVNVRSWDIEFVGTRLIIREGSHKILFDITFSPPSAVVINRGRFLYNGVELLITPDWCALLNNCSLLAGNSAQGDHYAGLVLGDDPHPPAGLIRLSAIPREGWDRTAAVRWVRNAAAARAGLTGVVNDLIEAQSLASPC